MALLGLMTMDSEAAQWAFGQTDRSIDKLTRNPLNDGRALADLDLTTTEQAVAHGLERKPKGFVVISKDAAQHVFESTKADEKHLFLKSDGTVTCSVWVF